MQLSNDFNPSPPNAAIGSNDDACKNTNIAFKRITVNSVNLVD